MRFSSCVVVILFLALPLNGAGLTVGAEFPVATPRYVALPDDAVRKKPSVASDGSSFLAVWIDHRNPSVLPSGLFATRVTSSGEVIDPLGIRLDAEPGLFAAPVVAWTGVEYVVVYPKGQFGGASVMVVSRDGEVRDGHALALPVSGPVYPEALTWTGSQLVLRWLHAPFRGAETRYWTFLTARGEVISSTTVSPQIIESDPTLASAGSVSLRVGLPFAELLDDRGAHIHTVQLASVASVQRQPAVSWNGREFAVTWNESEPGPWRIGRLSSRGEVLSGEGITLPDGADSALASDGSAFLVAWATNYTVGAFRYESNDAISAEIRLASTPHSAFSYERPGLAFDGANYIATWTSCGDAQTAGTFARLVSRFGHLATDAIRLSPDSCTRGSVVAAGKSQSLVAWIESAYPWRVVVRRLSFSGVPLDSAPIAIGETSSTELALASSGEDFLIVYRNTVPNRVRAAIVAADGSIRARDIELFGNPNASAPTLAATWNGVHYVVAATGEQQGLENMYAARVSRDGVVLDVTALARGSYDHEPALVSFARGRSLLVYKRIAHEPQYGHVPRIFGRFLDDPPRARAVR